MDPTDLIATLSTGLILTLHLDPHSCADDYFNLYIYKYLVHKISDTPSVSLRYNF